jgi:hypothetical protein
MDLPNTVLNLQRNPELVAWRSRGTFVRVTEGGTLEKVGIKHPYRWVPNVRDIIATDWQFGTREQAMKYAQQIFAPAEG